MFCTTQSVKVLSNPGKVKFGGLTQLLRYVRENKNSDLTYYAKIEDTTLSDLLRQDIIMPEKQLMAFYDYRWKDFTDNEMSTGLYIVFYQGGPVDNFTHVPGAVSQSSAESEYNTACTAVMDPSQSSMLKMN